MWQAISILFPGESNVPKTRVCERWRPQVQRSTMTGRKRRPLAPTNHSLHRGLNKCFFLHLFSGRIHFCSSGPREFRSQRCIFFVSLPLGSFLPFSLVMGSEQRPAWEVLNRPAAENCQLKEEREEEAGEMVREVDERKDDGGG